MSQKSSAENEYARLLQVMARLLAPDGCPWDREQDHKSLRPYLLEEAYEVIEAIESGDPEHLCEELGDLLLQVVFHAQLATENGDFTADDVARGIVEKLIRRHPHVFGDAKVKDSADVIKNWDAIKKMEKAGKGKKAKSRLDVVSKRFPALTEAFEVSRKAAKTGFDWKKPADVFGKVEEEIDEVRQAVKSRDKDKREDELGDLLFSVVNLCRVYDVHPEIALRRASGKFRRRFARVETLAGDDFAGKKKNDFKTWDDLWNKAKKDVG